MFKKNSFFCEIDRPIHILRICYFVSFKANFASVLFFSCSWLLLRGRGYWGPVGSERKKTSQKCRSGSDRAPETRKNLISNAFFVLVLLYLQWRAPANGYENNVNEYDECSIDVIPFIFPRSFLKMETLG